MEPTRLRHCVEQPLSALYFTLFLEMWLDPRPVVRNEEGRVESIEVSWSSKYVYAHPVSSDQATYDDMPRIVSRVAP